MTESAPKFDALFADLVPAYLLEKRRQLAELRREIVQGNLEPVGRVAHGIKGTGSLYGLPEASRLGRALETAGQQGNGARAAALVDELDTLLARVQQQLGGRA